MSIPTKLKAGVSELTNFKKLWRDSLAENERASWRDLFRSQTSQADIRRQLLAKLKINLRFDKQLSAFRAWEAKQHAIDLEAERRIAEEHPDWTKDQVRDDLLRRFYNQARATGDAKLGLETIAADVKVESLQFDKEKFTEGLRTKIRAGLDAILSEANNNPVIKAAVEQILKATAKE
jgi:hypothetical protein